MFFFKNICYPDLPKALTLLDVDVFAKKLVKKLQKLLNHVALSYFCKVRYKTRYWQESRGSISKSDIIMNRRRSILRIFAILAMLCIISSNANETDNHNALSLVQDVTSDIEKAHELATQIKDTTDKEEEAIKNVAKVLHDETESLIALLNGPMSGVLAQAAKLLDGTKNCQDLANLGITESGTYQLDPDGLDEGEEPILVKCDFSDNSTEIVHDHDHEIAMEVCTEAPDCNTYRFDYQVPESQMRALIESSETCQQSIRFDCFLTPLTRYGKYDLGAWKSFNSSVRNTFFHGNRNGTEHFCQCGIDKTCIEPNVPCNCDAKLPTWQADEGIITDKEQLPIVEFAYGPIKYDLEKAKLSIGHLKCSGTTTSCASDASKGGSFGPPQILKDNCDLATFSNDRLKIILEYRSNQNCEIVLSLPAVKQMKLTIDEFYVSTKLTFCFVPVSILSFFVD